MVHGRTQLPVSLNKNTTLREEEGIADHQCAVEINRDNKIYRTITIFSNSESEFEDNQSLTGKLEANVGLCMHSE